MRKLFAGSLPLSVLLVFLELAKHSEATTKTWGADGYAEDTSCLNAWIVYLKRLFLIILTVSGVVLYYVPESRSHARYAGCMLIDFTANALKSALRASVSKFECVKSKIDYNQPERYKKGASFEDIPSCVGKGFSYTDDNRWQKRRKLSWRSKDIDYQSSDCNVTEDLVRTLEERRAMRLSCKGESSERHHRRHHGRHRHRSQNRLCDDGVVPPACGRYLRAASPTRLYTDEMEQLYKYAKKKFDSTSSTKLPPAEHTSTFLISGTPRQMAMIDQRYEKDNIVILPSGYHRKEDNGAPTINVIKYPRMANKREPSVSEQEGPTRDHDHCIATESAMTTEAQHPTKRANCHANVTKWSSVRAETTKDQRSMPFTDELGRVHFSTKRHRFGEYEEGNESMAHTYYENVEEEQEDFDRNYDEVEHRSRRSPANTIVMRTAEVDMGNESDFPPATVRDDHEETHSSEQDMEPTVHYENSQYGDTRRDLDQVPRKEGHLTWQDYDDEREFFRGDCVQSENHNGVEKPALLRAVKWLFGGCPEAAARQEREGSEDRKGRNS